MNPMTLKVMAEVKGAARNQQRTAAPTHDTHDAQDGPLDDGTYTGRERHSTVYSEPQVAATLAGDRKSRRGPLRRKRATRTESFEDDHSHTVLPGPRIPCPHSDSDTPLSHTNATTITATTPTPATLPPRPLQAIAEVYGDLPTAKFYDTKLYPQHLSLQQIDDELKELETKREESRQAMSDTLSQQLHRTHFADNKPHVSYATPTLSPSFPTPNPTPTPVTNGLVLANPITPVNVETPPTAPSIVAPTIVLGGATNLPLAQAPHQFIDVVDVDKRAFGIGPIKFLESHTRTPSSGAISTTPTTTGGPLRVLAGAEPNPARHGGGSSGSRGMHARLDALADQLDQLEMSANALQHDLAFSVKAVNNIDTGNADTELRSSSIFIHQSTDEEAASSPSSPTATASPQRSPSYHAASTPLNDNPTASSPSPSPSTAKFRVVRQLVDQQTQQRINDAMAIIGREPVNMSNNNNHNNNSSTVNLSPTTPKRRSWLPTESDMLSPLQIQKLLSLNTTLNASAELDKTVDWDEVEKILQE